jgi:hypothetical protein
MRVSDSNRILFVHNPKSAGASLEKLLDKRVPDIRQPYWRHATLAEILAGEPGLTDYWIFGFVRNPWDRMVSWWSMIENARIAAENGNEKQIWRFEHYEEWRTVRGFDFPTFVTRGADEYERIGMPQVDLLYAEARRPDFVGRVEDLLTGVNLVRDRLGLRPKPTMPHQHQGSRGPYRDYYDAATRDRVAKLFAADIDEFGYEF